MFSSKIVDTDAFMDMPQSSQLLYFHLAMRADDDGFISNPKKIMRMVGSQEDDYKVLSVKKFIIPFDSGICVIKHWLIHNLVRGDRYTETQYGKEKSMLVVDKQTKKYSLTKPENSNVIPNGNQSSTTGMSQVRLGKVRLGKKIPSTTVEEQSSDVQVFGNEDINWVLDTFKSIMGFESSGRKQQDRFMAKHLLDKFNKIQIQGMLKYCATNEYAPRIGSIEKLWQKRGDVVAGIQSLQNKTKGIIQSI